MHNFIWSKPVHFTTLLFFPASDWTKYPQEYSVSSENAKRIDTPLDAAIWLQHFKAQNVNLLEELKVGDFNFKLNFYITNNNFSVNISQ